MPRAPTGASCPNERHRRRSRPPGREDSLYGHRESGGSPESMGMGRGGLSGGGRSRPTPTSSSKRSVGEKHSVARSVGLRRLGRRSLAAAARMAAPWCRPRLRLGRRLRLERRLRLGRRRRSGPRGRRREKGRRRSAGLQEVVVRPPSLAASAAATSAVAAAAAQPSAPAAAAGSAARSSTAACSPARTSRTAAASLCSAPLPLLSTTSLCSAPHGWQPRHRPAPPSVRLRLPVHTAVRTRLHGRLPTRARPRGPPRRLLSRACNRNRGSRLCIAWRHAVGWSRDSQRTAPDSLGLNRPTAASRLLAAAFAAWKIRQRGLALSGCSGGSSQGSRSRHAAARRRCGGAVGGVGDAFAERRSEQAVGPQPCMRRAGGAAPQGWRMVRERLSIFGGFTCSLFRALTDHTFLSPFTKESCVGTRLRILDIL